VTGVRGHHATVVEVDEVEEFARAAFDELSTRVQPAREHVEPCVMCKGMGQADGFMAFLWGFSCWGCGGSGVVMSGYRGLRGPFRAAPGRSMTVGGGS
jgi:hypothetical protein